MKYIIHIILVISIILSCEQSEESLPTDKPYSHIKYFGFTIIDTYWDDPTDSQIRTNYAEEIQGFCNVADILVVHPSDNIIDRVSFFNELGLQAILHLNELFFEIIDSNSASGTNYDLRSDYEERWQEFKSINQTILHNDNIAALYIGEEPNWNGISYSELNTVSQLLELDYPTIPSMIIEAYPTLSDIQIPETIDWIGFDRYFILDPNTNKEFQQDWDILKSKMSNPNQHIMVIMDSHFIDWAHGDYGNIEEGQMGEVARNYYDLAKSDDKVIGILGYFWPNGFDISNSIGARGMPQNVKSEYERIGNEITNQ